MTALNELTATEAGAMIAAREISSEELVRACLDRIAAREDTVGAWQWLDPDRALDQARAADVAEPRSPLHGVPYGVKDIIDTAGIPTEYGSPIFAGHLPGRDSPCVARMREAGAVLLGKTVTTEFATFHPGKTANPHDPAHTPGGSSSGSGAAVGDGMVPLAFGSQTAGSLIRPASFCGVCGLKPTHGTVDLSGVFELEAALDTLGYMARSVDDLALFYAVVRGVRPEPLENGIGRAPRIGVCRTFHWDQAQPETVSAVEDAARRLAGLGAEVGEMNLPDEFSTIVETHRIVLNVGLTRTLGELYRDERERLSERLRAMIEAGMEVAPDRYESAKAHAESCRAASDAAFGDWDVLLAPSAPGEAPRGLESTGDPVFQIPWTLLHVPCVTIPGATGPNGLPVGVQLVGRRGDDDTVLRIAKWFHGRG